MPRELSIEERVAQFERRRFERRNAAAKRAHLIPEVETITARITTMEDGKTVRLYLNLSQEERAIVLDKSLDTIVFYEMPIYDKEEIARFIDNCNKEITEITGEIKFMDQFHEEEDERSKRDMREWIEEYREMIKDDVPKMRAAIFPLTLIDFLEYPFEHMCSSRREAVFFAAKLREIVGTITETISRYK